MANGRNEKGGGVKGTTPAKGGMKSIPKWMQTKDGLPF